MSRRLKAFRRSRRIAGDPTIGIWHLSVGTAARMQVDRKQRQSNHPAGRADPVLRPNPSSCLNATREGNLLIRFNFIRGVRALLMPTCEHGKTRVITLFANPVLSSSLAWGALDHIEDLLAYGLDRGDHGSALICRHHVFAALTCQRNTLNPAVNHQVSTACSSL